MISFIIIGKNVENTISLCLDSVFLFVKTNNITEFETIYVDSNSTDSSVSIAQKYPTRILIIKGEVNSAIGRNVGVKNSVGETLFLIDGDMELLPDFYNKIFDHRIKRLVYPLINGYLCHFYYDDDFNFIYTNREKIPERSIFRNITGGLIIIDRFFWEKLEGMDEKFIRHQDLDFGLRMTKIGIRVKMYNELFAFHHTSEYFNKKRFSEFCLSKALFSSGRLMRKYILTPAYLKRYHFQVINSMLLILVLSLLFIKPVIGILSLFFYLLIQLYRTIRRNQENSNILRMFLFKFLFSFYCLFGLFFYYPRKPTYTVHKL